MSPSHSSFHHTAQFPWGSGPCLPTEWRALVTEVEIASASWSKSSVLWRYATRCSGKRITWIRQRRSLIQENAQVCRWGGLDRI